MKQYILFEKGKLYIVELPHTNGFSSTTEGKLKFKEAHTAALANKVEVKNHELISNICKSLHADVWFNDKGIKIKEGETFPLPDGIEVKISKKITKSIVNGKAPFEEYAILFSVEPEKPEEGPVICLKCKEVWNSRPIGEECMCGGKTFHKTHPSNAKPEETQEELYEAWLREYVWINPSEKSDIPIDWKTHDKVKKHILKRFTIQRKKS